MPTVHTQTRNFLIACGASLAILWIVFLLARPQLIYASVSANYLPHSFCYLGDTRLISLHVVSDTIIWLSYMAISATLGYFLWKNRKLLPFQVIFVAFSLFVVACGLTHLMDVVVLWDPLYWLSGEVKLVTAIFSAITACMLPSMLPKMNTLLRDVYRARTLEARFIAAVEGGTDAFYIMEAGRNTAHEIIDFTYVFINRNVEKMALLPGTDDMLGHSLCEFPIAGGAVTFLELFNLFKNVMATGKPQICEFQRQHPDRPVSWIQMQIVHLADGVAVTATDITAHKNAEAQALYMAHHDTLTGLPNRNLMDERLQRTVYSADRYQHKVAVFMIDLDSFKHINDTWGHAIGDEVLVVAANRLKQAIRASDSILRLGGDEFVVILPDIHGQDDVELVANKILADLSLPIVTQAATLEVPCSIGISIYPDCATTTSQLLSTADEAMYFAKRHGGGRYSICAPHLVS